jgi:putative glycerol-1-phosphate prenyltransferase
MDVSHLLKKSDKQVWMLIDPGKCDIAQNVALAEKASNYGVSTILIGGSLISDDSFKQCVAEIKKAVDIPVLIFPGNYTQLSAEADGVLFLSLLSGRNPEYLIGQQVVSAPKIKFLGLNTVSTAYLLLDGGVVSSTQYISNTQPLPNGKPELAVATALAGEMMGMKWTYMDAGSGAVKAISEKTISAVSESCSSPLIIGGGIRTLQGIKRALSAGANAVVVGNAIEENPQFLEEIQSAIIEFKTESTQ